jgi:Cu(I)/Ag(I) efflux system membrane fusion protein
MSEPEIKPDATLRATTAQGTPPASERTDAEARRDSRRWWIKLFVQPLLILLAGAGLIVGLGIAQKAGWIAAGGGTAAHATAPDGESTRYICPMMCTPPQAEPGRCPVCAMELVPASSGSGPTDSQSVQIDPVARRLANIHTAPVKSIPLERTIRAVGQLNYDEGSLKTISAYVDGRLDRLYADYTGVVVEKGDHLALLYSPRLYSAQVELLLAKKSRDQSQSATLRRAVDSNQNLYQSARQRLIELGMTEEQIEQLEQSGEANSRMHLCAPISGTVIEKLGVEGQYVKEGQAIYHLADLSTVWLMLELFPEDAAAVRYGQKVDAEVHSLPGRTFSGRVAFLDPTVDPKKRTVGVRVVIRNDDGLLRVGDYAKASIHAPIAAANDRNVDFYDPELAGKWMGPQHPQIIASSPGKCPLCGAELVAAADFGYLDAPSAACNVLVVPRDAVLMNGGHSVVYVETEAGRFEIRHVTLGAGSDDQIVVLTGLDAGEEVATSGNFLIDSQMQLAGNPSLIDPMKAAPKPDDAKSPEIVAALSNLSDEDRALAARQRVCPVTLYPLGSMGTPPKVEIDGQTVFLCCEGCREALLEEPDKYLAILAERAASGGNEPAQPPVELPPIGEMELASPSPAEPSLGEPQTEPSEVSAIDAALTELSPEDRLLAKEQRVCPVAGTLLGSMGVPVKVMVRGRAVFICCEGCRASLLAEPAKYLAKLDQETVR